MSYELTKWLHIVSALLLFGTGLGSAFYKLMADLHGDVRVLAVVNRHVVLADWLFTTPTVILQPVTGVYLLHQLGIPLLEPWAVIVYGLYALAGICWLPVVWLQIRMRDLAIAARENNTPPPAAYWRLQRAWFALGWPAFIALLAAMWLMVDKPDFTF